jgi:hypothetical protein
VISKWRSSEEWTHEDIQLKKVSTTSLNGNKKLKTDMQQNREEVNKKSTIDSES